MQLEAVSLVERKGSVQEGVCHDEPAAHVVYSVLQEEGSTRWWLT